jgi:hypothetical protein
MATVLESPRAGKWEGLRAKVSASSMAEDSGVLRATVKVLAKGGVLEMV